jgi:hypothetical protein
MKKDQKSNDVPAMFSGEGEMEWMEEHRKELKQSVTGQRYLFQSLIFSFVLGLAAHVGGYFLLETATSGIPGLLADLLHALGWSLWTGVVVVMLTQVIPEAKRLQIKRAVEAFEALRREKVQTGSDQDRAALERTHEKRAKREQGQKRNRAQKGG